MTTRKLTGAVLAELKYHCWHNQSLDMTVRHFQRTQSLTSDVDIFEEVTQN
jgi:hypothetical protein